MREIVDLLDGVKRETSVEEQNQKLKKVRASLDMYFSDKELAEVDAAIAS
jgi:hypothetical protein